MSSLPSATSRPSGAELLRTIAAGTAASAGTAFLRSLVRHVAEALDAEIAFAAEVEEGAWERARVLAAHGRDGVELPEGYAFAIAGTPVRAGGRPRRGRDPERHPRPRSRATRSSRATGSRATWRSSCAAATAPGSATSA